MYFLNAFSLNMLTTDSTSIVEVIPLTLDQMMEVLAGVRSEPIVSAIGHVETAKLFSSVLGLDLQPNRITVQLQDGETALIGQYSGPRLAEGATSLPEGATIQWFLVGVKGEMK